MSTRADQNSRRACGRTRAMRSSRGSAPGAGVRGRPVYAVGWFTPPLWRAAPPIRDHTGRDGRVGERIAAPGPVPDQRTCTTSPALTTASVPSLSTTSRPSASNRTARPRRVVPPAGPGRETATSVPSVLQCDVIPSATAA